MRDEVRGLVAQNRGEAARSARRGAYDSSRRLSMRTANWTPRMIVLATRGLAGLGAFWAKDLVPGISAAYDGVLLLFQPLKIDQFSKKASSMLNRFRRSSLRTKIHVCPAALCDDRPSGRRDHHLDGAPMDSAVSSVISSRVAALNFAQ